MLFRSQLGPPELSKLLWEAELLRLAYETLDEVLATDADEISETLQKLIDRDPKLLQTITSIGVPVLSANGKDLFRGPFIRIPERPGQDEVVVGEEDVDTWAEKGWVDLRPKNMQHWQSRIQNMGRARQQLRMSGSAAITRNAYLTDEIHIGTIAGWVFNNEQGGYRIK